MSSEGDKEKTVSDKKSKGEEEKVVKPKKKDSEEQPQGPPPTPLSIGLFIVKTLLLSTLAIGAIILFAGWKQIGAEVSPTSIPSVVSHHMSRGEYVPIYDGFSSLNVFVVRHGFVDHSEETVLFLHDLPGSSIVFYDDQVELARHRVSSIALDFPGFGLSDKPADHAVKRYSVSHLADTVHSLLLSLHTDAVHIVARGNSIHIAKAFAARYPHEVSSVVAVSPAPFASKVPNLVALAFQASPALPRFVHSALFSAGAPLASFSPFSSSSSSSHDAANMWMLFYKSGYVPLGMLIRSALENGEVNPLSKDAFASFCKSKPCGLLGGDLLEGFKRLSGSCVGDAVTKFIGGLSREQKQGKAARAKARVVYTEPTGKYGMDEHGEHGHGGHDHVHGHHDHDHHEHDHSHGHHEHDHSHGHHDHDHSHDHHGHDHSHGHHHH